ncbi:hypothetical protein P175DRAFT_0503050 [Aspergillus ochraceoroseus IBT 24754]|uniref:4a-hydroxytetrahydrobiopterin dehydratase n=1 Tax=Aspergillus ochraceoroseus IBT 24754 TaxID=1392256 RepID=A0A2T5LTA5_9EURO|nr:uncharacterized protein P175DRAFT_0503050 [Aspergillus ochraceoroseus IBT 24754]PTU19514.1 hypothetical protein P175DRAFT_0503050 [Aspergillus ochraceoroseus IBT 24754]
MNPACRALPRRQGVFSRLPLKCGRHYSLHHPRPVLLASRNDHTRASCTHHLRAQFPHQATFRATSTMASEPQFATGVDPQQALPLLNALQGQGWSLDEESIGIKKTFYFRSYFKAVSFVNVIASQSATKKHHATMTVRIGSVDVHWTTHHPRGLTDKDISMAEYCEQAAQLMGAVEEGQGKKCGPGS